MIKVIELSVFRKKVEKILTKDGCSELKFFLQTYPEKGVVISGTGGVRKLRWKAGGKGKIGGARVIYYYHISDSEIILITIYTKNVKEDITSTEKKEMQKLVKLLTK